MPIHSESITNKENPEIVSWILQNQLDRCEDAYVTRNKLYAHCSANIVDLITQEKIGEFVFTIKTNLKKQVNEMLDVDITFKNPSNAQIEFAKKLKQSSDANEYYNAITEEGGCVQIETVNRHLIESDIEGEKCNVNLSALPFELSLYDDMKALNTEFGFAEGIKVGGTDITVSGYSENFIAPSDLFKSDINSDETFSFVIGKITKLQNCRIELDNETYDIIIAQLNTGVGNLTTVINPERYDINGIAEGKIIAMKADIKADFKLTDNYPKPEFVEKSKRTFWDRVKSIFR